MLHASRRLPLLLLNMSVSVATMSRTEREWPAAVKARCSGDDLLERDDVTGWMTPLKTRTMIKKSVNE